MVLSARRRPVIAALALGVLLGSASAALHVRALRHGLVPALAGRHVDAELVVRLVRDPTSVTTMSGAALVVTDATVTSVWQGVWRHESAPVLVLSYGGGWLGLLPGQRVDLTGRLSPPRRGDSVAAVVDARGPPLLVGRPPWWQRAAGSVRSALRTACRGLPPDARGLLPGLVDGDVSRQPPDLLTDLRLAGLTHLQAVSGENVTVLSSVTIGVAAALGLRRRWRVVVCAATLAGFVILARPSPSVLRAAVMGCIVLLAMATGRRPSALPMLSTAVLVLVVVNPFLARSIGFVLSVVATAALVLVAPSWTRRLSLRMPRWLAVAIAVPAAAQLACTPVLMLAFGTMTPYAVLANLAAAPAVPPATIAGLVCAVVATVSPVLAAAVAWLAAVPTLEIAQVARLTARLPGAGLRWPAVVELPLAAAIVIGAGVTAWRGRRRRRAILGEWPM